MRRKDTFKQSIFALMTSQVVIKILGLFYKLYLTNRDGFGDEGNAIANAGFQVFALFLSFVAIGIPTAISKLVAEELSRENYSGAHKVFKIALASFSIIGMLGSLLLCYFSDFLAKSYLHISEAKLSIIALAPSVFLVSIISVLKGYFGGRETIKKTAKAQTIDQLVKTIATVIMIECSIWYIKKADTEIMSALSNFSITLGNIAELLYLVYLYKKVLPEISYEINVSRFKNNLRVFSILRKLVYIAVPLSLTAIITTISKNIDSTTIVGELEKIIGYEEAKIQYGILCGKIDALINFPLSFNMAIAVVLLPSIASMNKLLKGNEDRINKSFFLGLAIAVPITFIFIVFSDEILKLLFPNASSGSNLLKISSISIVFITIEQLSNTILNGIDKNWVPIKAIFCGVIAKFVLNKILVPKVDFVFGGTIGASIATVVCHLIACLVSFFEIKKKVEISIKSFALPFSFSLIMIFICKTSFDFLGIIGDLKIRLLLSLALGGLVYLVIIVLFFWSEKKK